MSSDRTFFTNEPNRTLLDRFRRIVRNFQNFDILVGYFRISGFYQLAEVMEGVEKVRILVGMDFGRSVWEVMDVFQETEGRLDFESPKKLRELLTDYLKREIDCSEDSERVETGMRVFLKMLGAPCINFEEDLGIGNNGKQLEIRAHPSKKIHAKVYIGRYDLEKHDDFGKVVTGSSNFSWSGLVAKREFNVELKNRGDVEFALEHFDQLWKESVDVSEITRETILHKTWLNDEILPYHLYLKLLYEYLEEEINVDLDFESFLPDRFVELKYQKDAVATAKRILEAYNGVFIADVVGLGKTYTSALLAQQLPGRLLVICPPVLQDYWEESFREFGIRGHRVMSIGKIDSLKPEEIDKYRYVLIDEAHRFRNETTQGYVHIHRICSGKKVILVSATPLNNHIEDIFAQLKLFQAPMHSTIPGLSNLKGYFDRHRRALNRLDRNSEEYKEALREIAADIREKIFQYVMIRRTRYDVRKFYSQDLETRGLQFPKIGKPDRIIYEFSGKSEAAFLRTIGLIKKFSYARYTPLLYLKNQLSEFEQQSQRNIGGFMKTLLVKRLESSFHAFRLTIGRFVKSYEQFLGMYREGTVYISKKINVYDLLDADDDGLLESLLESGDVKGYPTSQFKNNFLHELERDLENLIELRDLWDTVSDDPKFEQLLSDLKGNKVLKNARPIIFTESRETGEYLFEQLNERFPGKVFFFSSKGGRSFQGQHNKHLSKDIIRVNFDPTLDSSEADIRFLVTTDVLAEGINLHRSNVVLNYDLPWNPTRLLQRAGRVNRLGTKHTQVHFFNVFPTSAADRHLGLEANIKAKIQAFHDTLGEDAQYLTDEEVTGTHELFGERLYRSVSDPTSYLGEEDEGMSELEFLELIRNIRDQQPELFQLVKRLPRKARSGLRTERIAGKGLLTFFRKGKLKKFYLAAEKGPIELNFFEAVRFLQCEPDARRISVPADFFEQLAKNKAAFAHATDEAIQEATGKEKAGSGNLNRVLNRLKDRGVRLFKGFTEDDEEFLKSVKQTLEAGNVPKATINKIKKALDTTLDPLKVLGIFREHITEDLIFRTEQGKGRRSRDKKEVILSAFLTNQMKN